MEPSVMKIVWSVDPFETEKQNLEIVARALAPFIDGGPSGATKKKGAGCGARLEAVYVASPAEADISTAFDVPAEERLSSYPHKVLTKRLKEVGVRLPAEQIHILPETSISRKAASDKLTEFARREKATFIAVATHARKGLRKALLGSFTETLVHRSPVSMLVVNPGVQPQPAIQTILFATDLEKTSRKSFVRVLQLATRLKAKVVVLHAQEPHLRTMAEDTGRTAERDRELKALARLHAKTEVPMETVIDAQLADIASRIRKQAGRHKADLIAVTAHASPIQSLLLGSVTRNLLRESTLPILIEKV